MSLSVHHGGSDVIIGAPFDASMIRPLVDEPTVGSGAGGPPLFPGSISIPEYAITEPSLSTARRFFSAANLYGRGCLAPRISPRPRRHLGSAYEHAGCRSRRYLGVRRRVVLRREPLRDHPVVFAHLILELARLE